MPGKFDRSGEMANVPAYIMRSALLATLVGVALAAIIALDLSSVAASGGNETHGKITARRLADDRIEFGWQPTDESGTAVADRVLPRARYFPTGAQVGRWLNSSPVEVGGAEIGRINARLTDDGRIEFAFTPTDGERILTDARYFPADARVGRWLSSTTIKFSLTTYGPPVSSSGFTAVSAGLNHSCAIRAGVITIECWGDNEYGQTDAPAGEFRAVSAGSLHTCAIRAEDGEIECWGYNHQGQADAPAGSFTAVSAGSVHSCAIGESGAIECWGDNRFGQTDAPAGSFSAVSADSWHTCAIGESGAIECWGDNRFGQTDAPAGSFSAVSAGSWHTCAIGEDGAIECWGANTDGRADAPAGAFRAVSAGDEYTCAIRAEDGEIECWGDNEYGQSDALTGRFTAIAAGLAHTCAIRAWRAIECWGDGIAGRSQYRT